MESFLKTPNGLHLPYRLFLKMEESIFFHFIFIAIGKGWLLIYAEEANQASSSWLTQGPRVSHLFSGISGITFSTRIFLVD